MGLVIRSGTAGSLGSERVNPNDEPATTNRTRLYGDTFGSGALDTLLWAATLVGTGTATEGSGRLAMATGATANSSSIIRSTQVGRFLMGSSCTWLGEVRLGDTGTANNKRRWGCFDANDGLFFELNGTVLSAVARKGTVDTAVASTSWNGTPFNVDTNYHRYEIVYVGNYVAYLIDGVVRHTLDDASATERTNTQHYKTSFENVNSGGSTTNVSMFARGTALDRYGPDSSTPRYTNLTAAASTVLKTGPGRLHRVQINRLAIASTVKLWDNTSAAGTVIALIDTTALRDTLIYELDFNTGLTVTLTGVPDVTVTWD
jgi:hypothetical protein